MKEPFFTVACISDLHIEFGIQNQAHPNREGVLKVCERLAKEENVQMMLVGGDIFSNDSKQSWDYSTYIKVRDRIAKDLKSATKSGRVLYANGNHDYEVGLKNGFNPYGFFDIMNKDIGFDSILLQRTDLKAIRTYPDNLLGAYKKINGINFIIVNQPYTGDSSFEISDRTFKWIESVFKKCNNQTTFLVCHSPLNDTQGMPGPYWLNEKDSKKFKKLLETQNNLIYLYGHSHSMDKTNSEFANDSFIRDDVFERMTLYNNDGTVIKDRTQPDGNVSAFMGSMSYCNNEFDHYSRLSEVQSPIVQALLIDVYNDKIVFRMKNYGEINPGKEEPDTFTLDRITSFTIR